MAERIRIRIMPDGRVVAETIGVKGAKCEDYMKTLSEMAEGKIVKSERKPEYYETEQAVESEEQIQKLKLDE